MEYKKRILENTCSTVDVKSKKILSMKVTDEQIHDSKALPELIENIIKSNEISSIGKLFADGAYDCKAVFKYWQTMESYHALK